MRKACPLSELAPGEALRLDTAPPAAKLPYAPTGCKSSTATS